MSRVKENSSDIGMFGYFSVLMLTCFCMIDCVRLFLTQNSYYKVLASDGIYLQSSQSPYNLFVIVLFLQIVFILHISYKHFCILLTGENVMIDDEDDLITNEGIETNASTVVCIIF